jgi:hypothetical protein
MNESFKQTLLDNCDDYLDTSDRGSDKTRSKLITRVAHDIAAIAQAKNLELPDDLEKVNNLIIIWFVYTEWHYQSVRTWFGNYASGNTKEERPGKSKSDTRGHPTSSKAWTAKSVCGQIFNARISDEQKSLSDGPDKDIGKYRAALSNVFDNLSEEEVKQCEDLAIEWNKTPLPDDIQRKYVISNPSQRYIDDTHLDSQRPFRRRLQISWSISISGPERSSLRSRLILMNMANRHMEGKNPVAYSDIFTLINHEIWDRGASVFRIQTGASDRPQ